LVGSGRGRGSAITLYERTVAFIRRYIEDNGLGPGDRLPPERELATLAGVSLVTARRALAELEAAGVLRREQGRGTFLREDRIEADPTIPGDWKRTLLSEVADLATRGLALTKRAATAHEAGRLGLAEGALLWEIERLRLRGTHPIALERALVPTVLAPSLDAVFDPSRDPLYATLEHHFGLAEAYEEQRLVARPPQEPERAALGLARSEWVIDIEGVAYAASHQPFDAFSLILRADTFELRLRSSADGRLISYAPAAT
jgi:DNA-binding GntR family transcriptional regulator